MIQSFLLPLSYIWSQWWIYIRSMQTDFAKSSSFLSKDIKAVKPSFLIWVHEHIIIPYIRAFKPTLAPTLCVQNVILSLLSQLWFALNRLHRKEKVSFTVKLVNPSEVRPAFVATDVAVDLWGFPLKWVARCRWEREMKATYHYSKARGENSETQSWQML